MFILMENTVEPSDEDNMTSFPNSLNCVSASCLQLHKKDKDQLLTGIHSTFLGNNSYVTLYRNQGSCIVYCMTQTGIYALWHTIALMGESVVISTTATVFTSASILKVHWDMSREPHVPLIEHQAVIFPPGRKLSSRSEQGILACDSAGVAVTPKGKKKTWGQTVMKESIVEE